jgi:hypothetical protein
VRSFLVFLGVIAIIGVVWAIMPKVEQHSLNHEQRLVASLNIVEDAIVSSSTDILRVNLFSPAIASLPGDGRWKLTGVLETQGRAGKAVHAKYVAVVVLSCTPYNDPECGAVESLSIKGEPLVVEGAVVAELQSVLGATADALAEALPGSSETTAAAEATPLPAPQISTAAPETAPAVKAPASETPAEQAPAQPEPPAAAESLAEPAADSQPAATAPATSDEPIQGDRIIFLIQKNLREMGYNPGPVDGQVGPRTTSAIQSYQQRAGLEMDGLPSEALLEHMIRSAQ